MQGGTDSAPQSRRGFRSLRLLALMVPLAAGWSVGFFLCKIQATVVPYRNYMLLGGLAGQLQFTPPRTIQIASMVIVILIWLGGSLLLQGRTRQSFFTLWQRDALSYLPLLSLPSVALLGPWPASKWIFDPLLLIALGGVFAT